MAGSRAGAERERGGGEQTALGWWSECLHSYLMSCFFPELEEMGGGGGWGGRNGEDGWVGGWRGGGIRL